MDHPDDLATMRYFLDRSVELLNAAGAMTIMALAFRAAEHIIAAAGRREI
jgi:hypothetical protein